MGKGDKRSRRGKITIGTFGVRRPKKRPKAEIKPAAKPKKKPVRKKKE